MLTSLLALLACLQSPTPALVLSVGSRPEFQEVALAIQSDLAKGDYASAVQLEPQLPKPKLTIGWDRNSIPTNQRDQFTDALKTMIDEWKFHIHDIDIAIAPAGDLNISFGKDLPKDSEGLPQESILRFGASPRLKAVIGLERGSPPQSIIPAMAFMEIGHAIGAYYGLADDPLYGTCMYRDNHPGLRTYSPSNGNYYLASQNLKASELIRQMIKDRKPVAVSFPHLVLTSPKTDIGTVRQGLKVPLDFVIKNTGNSPLGYNLVPDCGCFTKPAPGYVPGGQQVTIRTIVNTAEYTGRRDKMLVLYTNDPSDPVHQIPVSFLASPICRLYRVEGDTVLLPYEKGTVDVLMTIPEGSNIAPEQFTWNGGLEGKMTMEKWKGVVPDPELDEPAKPRTGYVFRLKIGKKQIPGRTSGTLEISTNDEEFPTLKYTLYAQTGMLAEPSEVFFGAVSSVSRNTFEVSQPGKPFKILSVETGSKSLKASLYPINAFTYRIDVMFDPSSAPHGDFVSYVKVKTTDLNSPVIMASVRGSVQ